MSTTGRARRRPLDPRRAAWRRAAAAGSLAAVLAAPALAAPAVAAVGTSSPAGAATAAPASVSPAAAVTAAGGQPADRSLVRLAVRWQPGARGQVLEAAARVTRAQGGSVRHRLAALRTVSMVVPRSAAARLRASLADTAGVRDVTEVQQRFPAFVPDDPDFARQAPYLREIGAPGAWNAARGSSSVRIAVVDTGVDVRHPDLGGQVAGAYNAVDGSGNVTDRVGHGTFVAGVAAAATDNARGVAGVGFASRLLAVKVAGPDTSIWADDEAAGIVWAADHGARVINLSLGSPDPDAAESEAVAYARRRGAVVVAAAGNESTSQLSYPAALPGVLAVGATDGAARASFSNHGSWVDVGAPGVGIRSTAPTAGSPVGRGYATGSGTSYSAPLVAGQVALVQAAHPKATAAQLVDAVKAGTTGSYGFARGRVSIPAALAFLAPQSVRVRSFAPDPFSPNGDRRSDTSRLTFNLASRQPVTVTLRSAGGTLVHGPRSLGTLPAGVHATTWDGRDKAGRPVGDGSYTATVTTRTFSSVGTVMVDRSVPAVSTLVGAGATFHPTPDGYRDRFTPSIVTPEALSALTLTISNPAGKRLRTLAAGPRPAGRVGVTWDGTRPDGSAYPAGAYLFRFVAQDLAGNQRVTNAYRVSIVRG